MCFPKNVPSIRRPSRRPHCSYPPTFEDFSDRQQAWARYHLYAFFLVLSGIVQNWLQGIRVAGLVNQDTVVIKKITPFGMHLARG
jgi:hypothetical protein